MPGRRAGPGDAADRCSWGVSPRAQRNGPHSLTKSAGRRRMAAKRAKGSRVGRTLQVAPIGAAGAIRGSARRGGLRAKAAGILRGLPLRGPTHHCSSPASMARPCSFAASMDATHGSGRGLNPFVPFVARLCQAYGGQAPPPLRLPPSPRLRRTRRRTRTPSPSATRTDQRPAAAPWRSLACCGSPPSGRGPAPWRRSCYP